MRKLTGAVFVSIDGVMQAPGGPEEDPTGGFEKGGWVAPFWSEDMGPFEKVIMGEYDLLLGAGKSIFDGSETPSGLKLADSFTTDKGVVISTYEPAGDVETATFETKEPSEQEVERRERMEAGTW